MPKNSPTYSATEILTMCLSLELEYGTFKILIDLIEDEMPLYGPDELVILMQASMVVLTRSLLKASLNKLSYL